MSAIFTSFYNQIETILEGVSSVKEIQKKPTLIFNKYPAAVFFPSSIENIFVTTAENSKQYKFKLFIVVGAEESTMEKIFCTVLPSVVDEVISEFDNKWSMNSIDGHRCWLRIDGGNWGVEKNSNGLMAVAEFDLIVKFMTDN